MIKETDFEGKSIFEGYVSTLCPITGVRDNYEIFIEYYSNGFILELYGLKKYLYSFNNEKMFQEDLTSKIKDDLTKLLKTNVGVHIYNNSNGMKLRTLL